MVCPVCGSENIRGTDYCANCGHDLRGLDQPELAGGRPDFIYHRLDDLALSAPPRVGHRDPAALAVYYMQNEATDSVLVMDGDELVGIITPWDILHKVAGPREDLNAYCCADMMTADPVVLLGRDDVAVALNKMSSGGFRHIPVRRDGGPASVVSIGALFRYLAPHLV